MHYLVNDVVLFEGLRCNVVGVYLGAAGTDTILGLLPPLASWYGERRVPASLVRLAYRPAPEISQQVLPKLKVGTRVLTPVGTIVSVVRDHFDEHPINERIVDLVTREGSKLQYRRYALEYAPFTDEENQAIYAKLQQIKQLRVNESENI